MSRFSGQVFSLKFCIAAQTRAHDVCSDNFSRANTPAHQSISTRATTPIALENVLRFWALCSNVSMSSWRHILVMIYRLSFAGFDSSIRSLSFIVTFPTTRRRTPNFSIFSVSFINSKTRRPTNSWDSAKRDITHPTATVVYNACYHLFRKRSCIAVYD